MLSKIGSDNISYNYSISSRNLVVIKQKTKLKIPNQIEVIGYDDMIMANWESYNLSTVRQPIRKMSKLTTQLIDDYLQDPDFEAANHLIEGKFIKRKSSK